MITMPREQAKSIETMLDEVFNKDIDDELIEELAESQTLIRNFLNKTVNNQTLWEELAEKGNIDERKSLISLIAITFIENDTNQMQIELLTSKHNKLGE